MRAQDRASIVHVQYGDDRTTAAGGLAAQAGVTVCPEAGMAGPDGTAIPKDTQNWPSQWGGGWYGGWYQPYWGQSGWASPNWTYGSPTLLRALPRAKRMRPETDAGNQPRTTFL